MRQQHVRDEASAGGRRMVVQGYQSDLRRLCVALRRDEDEHTARVRRTERPAGPRRERPVADS